MGFNLATVPTYNYKTTPEGKLVIVTEAAEKRGYDGDWLYSRQKGASIIGKYLF